MLQCVVAFAGRAMSCTSPIRCWRSANRNKDTGKYPVSFSNLNAMPYSLMTLPCGHCLGCKKDRSTSWGVRCVHESQMHDVSSFITLSYHPKHLPKDEMLDKKHCQDFLKRLRKNTGVKLRYMLCGEYGPRTLRAHYHALIFGYDFPDKVFYKQGKNGDNIYTSEELDGIWKKGMCVIGSVSYASAQYVAKYINKDNVIKLLEKDTNFKKPFNVMSLKPGIGMTWLVKNWQDVYPRDYVVIAGRKVKPPRAYDVWLEANHPEMFRMVKYARLKDGHAESMKMDMQKQDERMLSIDARNEFWSSERSDIGD